ncbi:MAG TPA: hypothetical protein VIY08_10180 [Candidatus Nitrosocosmicus sp.]
MNSASLSKAYKSERDANIKERLLLIIRISSDKQPVESVSRTTSSKVMGLQMVQNTTMKV